jgi:hypothetical protein
MGRHWLTAAAFPSKYIHAAHRMAMVKELSILGAALFVYFARQGRTQIHRIDPCRFSLLVYKTPSETDLALSGLKEEDFKKLLHGNSTDEDKSKFSVCFQNSIKDHEDMIFLNRMTEEDIDKFLKGKEPMSKQEVLKKLLPEYREFIEVFLPKEANELPPHRPFDHKIELKSEEKPPYHRNRPMLARELEVVKKYLDDHLQTNIYSPKVHLQLLLQCCLPES